ncbi:acyl-CoA reductase [Cohnella rhizosphaerae]|uniref:acyl-CoA reductase n=1 Tax=Cohnella rhizosphaerae TaxID=1457232 RepID=UPI003B8A62CF
MATELTFANRFSFSVLSANAIEEAAEAEMDRLVQQFYNDCYWFQQMACSSPRLVFLDRRVWRH